MSNFDLEAIEKRHAAGAPAKEDMADLIAEVKRLQNPNSVHNANTASIVEVKSQETLQKLKTGDNEKKD